jgi:hypothetical protein
LLTQVDNDFYSTPVRYMLINQLCTRKNGKHTAKNRYLDI